MKTDFRLWPIIFTIFLDLLGLGIIIPVFGPLFLDIHSGVLSADYPLHARTILLGLLIAAYPLTQFFGAPILGGYSDRLGRRPVFILSLLGTTLGYVIFALGVTHHILPLLFLGRIIDGFTGGNITTALSAIADISKGNEKTKNFGLAAVAVGTGFVLGPFFGGKLADASLVSWFTHATPFWFAGLLAGLNILLVIFLFKETLKRPKRSEISLMTGVHNIIRAFQLSDLRIVFIVIFLLNFGFNFFAQFFQVFLVQKFGLSESQIGDLFAYGGIWLVIGQGILTRPLSHLFRHSQVVWWSSLGLALSLLLLLLPERAVYLLVVMPVVAICQGLLQPNVTALISDMGHDDSQGEILGINQSIQSLAQAIPPILAGLIASIHSSLPIVVGSLATLLAWWIFVRLFRFPAAGQRLQLTKPVV